MKKRTKLKIRNFSLYLKKNILNSKYIVRNTSAVVLGVSFVGMLICGSKMISMSKEQNAVVASTEAHVGVVASTDIMRYNSDSIVLNEVAMIDPTSISSVKVAMDSDVEMVVEANEFQIVAQVQEEQKVEATGVEFAVSVPNTEDSTESASENTTENTTENTGNLQITGNITTQPTVPPQQIASEWRAPMSLTEEEVREMACVLTLECGNQCYEGQLAIANLIINRVLSGRWGSTVHDVLYAENQFSVVYTTAYANCMANGPQESCVQAVRDAASGNNNIGSYLSYRALWSVSPSNYTDYTIIQDHLFF
ncbi:MAG: cell wall hydrolase [Lachnospiraceae bacterium]|nr:cell wall hydrolase [Lachnospiraceae bacterium]